MVTTTRRAAWRSGPANGWHEDLLWYAAGIHQMRARTPELDDFLQVYRDFEAGQIPGQEAGPRLVAIASQWGDPRGLGYQSQVHGTFVDKPDWPAQALLKSLRLCNWARTCRASSLPCAVISIPCQATGRDHGRCNC